MSGLESRGASVGVGLVGSVLKVLPRGRVDGRE